MVCRTAAESGEMIWPRLIPVFMLCLMISGCESEGQTLAPYPLVESPHPEFMTMTSTTCFIQGPDAPRNGKSGQDIAFRDLAFLNIPGNLDLHLKDNSLYADSFVNLVSIDAAAAMQVPAPATNSRFLDIDTLFSHGGYLYIGRVIDTQSIGADIRSRFHDFECYDCIKNGNQVILTTTSGIILMDISDPTKPLLLGYLLAKERQWGIEE
ncbi:MAG: hypothetical protein EHM28_01510 [Spirochaetaceae bacterium]|nr:MAG: hypothetical protein EHM28_01510 [Spirochaetaceae bacterium]